jgi:predicted MFS family arabinose efflux permease
MAHDNQAGMQAIISLPDVPDSQRAWIVAAAAFIVGFAVFGLLYSFGSFFDAMSNELDASNTATSAFFAIIGLAFYLCGPLCGHLGDRFGPRLLIIAGVFLVTAQALPGSIARHQTLPARSTNRAPSFLSACPAPLCRSRSDSDKTRFGNPSELHGRDSVHTA